ncbi:MAG: hypothetical protein V5A66_02650 [Candidatus Thermoplasmatota archaeon]
MHLKRKKYRDPATRKLQEEGLLKLKRKKARGDTVRKIKEFGKITYDFWSGVKYIVVLSAILWWIPLFGPMLAGYVGGRRTGGPKKGILASILGIGIIGALYYFLNYGYLYLTMESIFEYPDRIIALVTSNSFFGPYFEFFRQYWTTFFDRVWAGVPFGSNSYILTMIFAYVGGTISYEKRKEFTDGVRSLDKVKSELSSIHRYAKNPMQTQKSVEGNKTHAHLGDLQPVRYSGQKMGKKKFPENQRINKSKQRSPSEEKRMKKKEENVRQNRGKHMFQDERAIPKSEVRHHSKSNGEDWEFL